MDRLLPVIKKIHFSARLDPVRDWFVLVGFSLITLAGIVAWNIWAFDTVANGGVIGGAAVEDEHAISANSVDAIRSVFTKRAEEEIKYQTATYRFADPSQ